MMVYFMFVYMVLLRLLGLCDLCLFSTYVVSFRPLEVGYRTTKIFDFGWIEYFGGQCLYWVLLISVRLISVFIRSYVHFFFFYFRLEMGSKQLILLHFPWAWTCDYLNIYTVKNHCRQDINMY